ncbi:MAG TPA: ABC transporter ATP-binding protein [Ktedonobacterales bacterium]|nr:ABC transporter ATP-binding protein [Ktedonobacterales bacterium]
MEGIIEVDRLVKRYRRATVNAVDGICFSVQPGAFFALLGPNGAGKTTTISVLTTTLASTAGSVRIAGYNAVRQAAEVRRNIGIIFQKPSLDLNLTAEENVRFHAILYGLYPFRPSFASMPRDYREQVERLAGMLGIADALGKSVKKLSGGMQRKLEIVRSLLHQPKILFLDEPTAGLDPQSRRNLWDYLRTIRAESGVTLFLTTHYLDEAEQVDNICVINSGRIVSMGTPADVKAQLVKDYLLLDAANREQLRAELCRKNIPFTETPLFRIEIAGGAVQQALRQIETPLSVVQTRTPSLEDAYLEIVRPS